jgi:hypothetical protein
MISQNGWWIIIAAVLVGHFGLHIAIYNRVNGFGWPRRVVKGIVKLFFVLSLAIPLLVYFTAGDEIRRVVSDRAYLAEIPFPVTAYSAVCLAAWILLGIPWLLWRPVFGLEWIRIHRRVEVIDVQSVSPHRLDLSARCKWESRIPLNQLFDLAVDEIELPVQGLPAALDGYRIAHLSDIHLTGHVHPEFTRYAVERATSWQPDLMALTGDIIDVQACIEWLPEIFSAADATDGCYYVLGNHDTRVVDPGQTRAAMDRARCTACPHC